MLFYWSITCIAVEFFPLLLLKLAKLVFIVLWWGSWNCWSCHEHPQTFYNRYINNDEFEFFQPNMDGRNCYSDEHYFPTFFHVSIQNFVLLIAIEISTLLTTLLSSYYRPFLDERPRWNCKLVSNLCWLVGNEVASKSIQGKGYYFRTPEEYYGTMKETSSLHYSTFAIKCQSFSDFPFGFPFSLLMRICITQVTERYGHILS